MTSNNNNHHTSDTADWLVPSQAINHSSRSNPNRNNNNRQRRQRAGPRQSDSADPLPNPSASSVPTPGIGATTAAASVEQQQQQQPGSTAAARSSNKKGRANNSRKKPPAAAAAQQQLPALPDTTAAPPKLLPIQPKKKRNNNSNKKNQQRHAWWRSQVPKDAVDPITLDPLIRLNYPPFALMAHEPYVPIDWPPVNNNHQNDNKDEELVVSEAERQRRILQEQWGSVALGKTKTSDSENDPEDDTKKPAATGASTEQNQKQQHHVNLFDGRALAYYMVSQLQFIDPLNRRDLTRDELVHLDRYLRRHLFLDLNVCEAYDAKGVSLSTAGAAAPTPSGRARILQDEARNLLQALFGSPSSSSSRATAGTSNNNTNAITTNSLAQLYQRHEAAQQQQMQMQNNAVTLAAGAAAQQDMYFPEDSSGLHVIDDDLNPGLRGNAAAFVPTSLYSASHIVSRNHSSPREQDFPSLQAAVPPSSGEEAAPVKKNNLPPAKTLAKIGSLVQKTDPEELQRQWEAREEARKKALLSNLTFGSNHALQNEPARNAQGFPAQITTTSNTVELSEAQLERNRAFAEALGVVPATQRSNLSAGWQRPADGRLLLDEYGVELNLTQYPESLVVMAREQISATFLLKLEKKWKTFLADDTAASLPLNPMDRPTRAFVHAYSEYWKLRTESFDREPKRYIHCVKLRETSAPYPLLSVALPHWQRPMAAAFGVVPDHSSRQTAGQTTQQPSSLVVVARELAPGPDRVPLTLKPRTAGGAVVVELPPSSNSTGVSISGTRHRSMEETNGVSAASTSTTTDTMSGGRFQGLVERERPKLELQKRTQPLEDLPPLLEAMDEAEAAAAAAALKQRQQAKAQRERALAARQEQVLAQAFASDDEDDDEDAPKTQLRGGNDSDSDWEEQPAMFVGEEEEDTA